MYGLLPRGVNSTLLALIPKGDSQTTIRDYRPISCLNTTYKVISKLLANRLKHCLPDLIKPNQSAFIKDRLLLENVLLATELVKDYHRTSLSSRATLKLDISKAFDSLEWNFMLGVLRAMGFPALFTHWIRLCISTAMFSVVVNGELAGYFPSSRGICQGCSLSPYLYVIANNILSKMLNNAAENSLFGYHSLCRDLSITHLSFADDILVFTDGATTSLTGVLQVMNQYASISGLQINKQKSSIFIGGRPTSIAALATGHGFRVEKLPIRYLGLPLTTRSMKHNDYEPLVERIQQRLLAWSTKTLSYAGRLQLIKAVIMGITNLWQSVFSLPMKCLDKIERLCSNFLWSGTPLDHTKSKVSWKDICFPYSEGGLGIRSLRDTARVFSLALIWHLVTKKSSLWVSWTQRYLLRQSTFWEAKATTATGSWIWRKLLSIRSLTHHFHRIKLGSGTTARFWSDNWHGPRPILDLVSEAGFSALGIPRHASVSAAVQGTRWNFRRVRDPLLCAIVEDIQRIKPPHVEDPPDSHLWKQSLGNYTDRFNSDCTWEQIRTHKQLVAWKSIVWFPQRIPRLSFVLWLAMRNRLSTGTRMRAWGIEQHCTFCNDPEVSREHLFFNCQQTNLIWTEITGPFFSAPPPTNWNNITESLSSQHLNRLDKVLLKILFHAGVYYVWKERNDRRHAAPAKSTATIIQLLRNNVSAHIQALNYSYPHKLAGLQDRWNQT